MSLNIKGVFGGRTFAAALIAVLAFALLVAVAAPGVGAASGTRVAAVKVTQAAVTPSVNTISASKVIAVPAPTISASKRVDATKVIPISRNQVQVGNQQKPSTPNCNQLAGPISGELSCGNVTIYGDVRIYGPNGHLTVIGPTLKFNGPYRLEVYGNGKLTIRSNTEVSLSQRSEIGYTIGTQGESGVQIQGTSGNPVTMRDAQDVYLEGPTEISYLEYHDNFNGLTVQSGATIEHSKFYDNGKYGLNINGGGVSVSESEFYGTAPGKQEIGIFLNYAQNASIQGNYIHGNSVAGIKSIMPVPEPERLGPTMHSGKAVPNVLRDNTITDNYGDGVIEYTLGLDIDSQQAGMISNNDKHGLVAIDTDVNADIETSIGDGNGLGKAANLRSTRVGGIIHDGNMSTNPVYVTYCEEDITDCTNYEGSRNDAYQYADYTQPYSTTRRLYPNQGYFTSTLVASEEHTFNGNHGMWTPRFLVYNYRLVSNTRNYACDENPYNCAARAVTTYSGGDFGASYTGIVPGPTFEYVFVWLFHDMLSGRKGSTQAAIQTKTTGRHPAVKVSVSSVPVLNAVKTPPSDRLPAKKV